MNDSAQAPEEGQMNDSAEAPGEGQINVPAVEKSGLRLVLIGTIPF